MKRFGAVLALAFLSLAGVGQAQTDTAAILLPPGVPPLPDPVSGSVKGLIIGPENHSFYKEILLPEFYSGAASRNVYLDAVAKLNYDIQLDQDWVAGTAELDDAAKGFRADGSLDFSFPMKRGFLFGDGASLAKEWRRLLDARRDFDSEQFEGGRSAQLEKNSAFAKRLLWNWNSVLWSNGIIDHHLRILWLKNGAPYRNVRGNFKRIYPKIIDPTFGYPQLFREQFLFYYPQSLNGLSWLTFRFEDFEEDIIWAYSPAIKKVRELTAANRSDSLATSSLAADDFLGWSGNPNFVKARVLSKSQMLAPFSSLDILPLDNSAGCLKVVGRAQSESAIMWNFESPKFKGGADWLPVQGAFVPRELYKLEVASRDPYYLYGREELYLDAETMLPFYKVVYDRAGRHWKTIVVGWSFGRSGDGLRFIPVPGFEIVLDVIAKKTFVMDFSRFRSCREYPGDLKLADFDPRRLIVNSQ
jgi:hypothetical protein